MIRTHLVKLIFALAGAFVVLLAFAAIQAALDAAWPADVVLVPAGVYHENVPVSTDRARDGVLLRHVGGFAIIGSTFVDNDYGVFRPRLRGARTG